VGDDGQAHMCAVASVNIDQTELHKKHHMGLDRTLYLAKRLDPEVSRDSVKRVVKCRERYQSIDPVPAM
ncbi:hypothetical protein SK128_000100, partial [Halocaridina rubra]